LHHYPNIELQQTLDCENPACEGEGPTALAEDADEVGNAEVETVSATSEPSDTSDASETSETSEDQSEETEGTSEPPTGAPEEHDREVTRRNRKKYWKVLSSVSYARYSRRSTC
jgi:hypothetical protein